MMLNADMTDLTEHQTTLLGSALNDARAAMLRLASVLESIGSPSVTTVPLGPRYVALIVPQENAAPVRLALTRRERA